MRYRGIHAFVVSAVLLFMCGRVTAQTGSEVYGMRCASCHGQDGSGKTNAAKTFNGMPDLRSQAVQTLSNKELFDRIARGLDHKKYPHVFLQTGLTQTDVAGVVDHLRALAKK